MVNKITLLLLVAVSFSCGSRKVEKSKEVVKTETSQTDTSVTTINTSSNTVEIYNSETEEVIITPIDTTRAFFVNNRPYKNVVLKVKKTKDNRVIEKEVNVSSVENKNVETKTVSESVKEVKNIEKKESFIFRYSWILLLLLILLILILKKYKDKIWWI